MILKEPICKKKLEVEHIATPKCTAKRSACAIPTGIGKDAVYMRRAIIVEKLMPLIGTSVPCKAFKGRKVYIRPLSIDETATRAAQRYESTIAALHLVEALRKATLVKTTAPHSRKQEKLRFVKVHELSASLRDIGDVKIIVGEQNNKRVIHYCITKKNN